MGKATPHSCSLCLGGVILIFMLAFAAFGPQFKDHTYFQTHLELKNLPPSQKFWFGTDDLGRDIFTRACYGARISLLIGVAAALIDMIIGVIWGSIAACSGGVVDEMMVQFMDILDSLPYILIVILLMVVFGHGLIPIIAAMSLMGWTTMARIVRGQILQLKECEFALAATALGAKRSYILFFELLPNAFSPIITTVTLTIPVAIYGEAFLSFLGLGVQIPIASWGTMASEGLPALKFYPWRLFFPVSLISITIIGFNLIGDGLRDYFDPRTYARELK